MSNTTDLSYGFKLINKSEFFTLINEFRQIQDDFLKLFGVDDIFSNSKIYEVIIANTLGHTMIPGHSGSKDAMDNNKEEYEYKHFKETSSNHSWTFNDYSDNTIESLKHVKAVIFAHIDDNQYPPYFDWCINVPGNICADYLRQRTEDLLRKMPKGHQNKRRMINFSEKQLVEDLHINRTSFPKSDLRNSRYGSWLERIYGINTELERCTKVKNILTSNKIWEVLVAVELNHNVNSEQGGREGAHDAYDNYGSLYEYKVSKSSSWTFQDISDNVLNKYSQDKMIMLAIVDKTLIKLKKIYAAEPKNVVELLKLKLAEKEKRYQERGKKIPRLEVSLSTGDLVKIGAKKIF